MRSRGAAGRDQITPAFIKAFGQNAKRTLHVLCNESWNAQKKSHRIGELQRQSPAQGRKRSCLNRLVQANQPDFMSFEINGTYDSFQSCAID